MSQNGTFCVYIINDKRKSGMTKEVFQQVAQRLRPRLTEQARRYLTDGEDAEDVVQDVLLRLWQMHERLHPPIDSLASVLTRNICIDWLRRQRSVGYGLIAADADTDTDNHERIERMMAVVDTLPDAQQTLLRLRHMQGMEMKKLASLLQMNETAGARMAVRLLKWATHWLSAMPAL